MEQTSMDNYSFDDYRDAFMVILGAQVQRKGIFLVDEGAYRAMADNTHGAAVAAAQRLQAERKLHAIVALADLKREMQSKPVRLTGGGNP